MNRIVKVLAVVVLFCLSISLAQEVDRLKKEIEAALVCQCGCSLTVRDCNHTDCGFALPGKKRIAQMLAEGKTKDEILDYYVATFGQTILSAPPKTDLFAWITPFIIALVALLVLINYLKHRPGEPPVSAISREDEKIPYEDIIERELKKME